jgi:hypothetical protein
LQIFINKNYDKLTDDPDIETKYCIKNELDDDDDDDDDGFKFIEDKSRIISDPIFDIFEKCQAGICFSTDANTRELSALILITGTQNRLKTDYIRDYTEVLGIKHAEYVDYAKNNVDEFIKYTYKLINNLMDLYFDFVNNDKLPRYIGCMTFKSNSENVTYNHKFFKINIKSKKTNKIFTLFYSYCIPDDKKGRFNKGGFYYLINIIPFESKINKYGMNTLIVAAGVYIYKPVDYKCQLGIEFDNVVDNDTSFPISKTRSNDTCYVFIGYYFADVFPFTRNRIQNAILKNGELRHDYYLT